MGLLDALVSEKIKKNANDRQSQALIDSMEQRITSNFQNQWAKDDQKNNINDANPLGEDIQAQRQKTLEASIKAMDTIRKQGLPPSEVLTMGKMISPETFKEDNPLADALKEANLVNAQNKPQEDAQKAFAGIVEKNNPLKVSSRSGLGMAANATQRADRALALLDNNILTNQDLQGIVGDYAGILQGGAPTVQGMQDSEYKSSQQSLKGLAQFISGNPQDAVPEKFKQHIKDNLLELKKTSDGYIQKNFRAVEQANAPIISKFPDEWNKFKSEWVSQDTSQNSKIPTYDPKTQKLQQNSKGEYRVVSK